jgi:hypothetical protein
LEAFIKIVEAGPFLKALYDNFISDFEKKINQLSLVRIACATAKYLPSRT